MKVFLSMISLMNEKIYLKLEIPEICFFEKGEGTSYFKSKNNGIF